MNLLPTLVLMALAVPFCSHCLVVPFPWGQGKVLGLWFLYPISTSHQLRTDGPQSYVTITYL